MCPMSMMSSHHNVALLFPLLFVGCYGVSRGNRPSITCFSFFGEFLKNGTFVMVEPLREVKCAEKSTHCFLEVYFS
uniref:Secreted protein n=1 Tax=Ascaris lumbricoides TaxID=6252 RepID=A0A0M3I660_ASCLU